MSDFISNDGIPVSLPSGGNDPLTLVRATDDKYLDCPVLNKTRVLTSFRGVCTQLEYQLRDRAGNAVNICSVVDNRDLSVTTTTPAPGEQTSQVLWRFRDAFGYSNEVYQVVGWSHDCENGLVRVNTPDILVDNANIWRFNIGIKDDQGNIQVVDEGLLSVERGLFVNVDTTSQLGGPITIGEVRLHMRDTVTENDLWDDFEFSDAEIIHAMSLPIMQWNETTPAVGNFDAQTFPWRYNWLQATVGNLLKIAAHWYRRNKLKANHGGVSVDDKNKDVDYLQVSRMLEADWKEWMMNKKKEINIARASGTVISTYGYGWF
jgi:hypothetical protein